VVPVLVLQVLWAVAAVCAAALLRRRFAKDWRASASFGVPAVVCLAVAAWLASGGATLAAIVAVVAAANCAAAAAVFVPTKSSRFRDFERRFWAHVAHRERSLD
jgi:hypothetical protein